VAICRSSHSGRFRFGLLSFWIIGLPRLATARWQWRWTPGSIGQDLIQRSQFCVPGWSSIRRVRRWLSEKCQVSEIIKWWELFFLKKKKGDPEYLPTPQKSDLFLLKPISLAPMTADRTKGIIAIKSYRLRNYARLTLTQMKGQQIHPLFWLPSRAEKSWSW
jgi:hypothetical protein